MAEDTKASKGRRLSYKEMKEMFPKSMEGVKKEDLKQRTTTGWFSKEDAEKEFHGKIRRQALEQNNPTLKKLRGFGINTDNIEKKKK